MVDVSPSSPRGRGFVVRDRGRELGVVTVSITDGGRTMYNAWTAPFDLVWRWGLGRCTSLDEAVSRIERFAAGVPFSYATKIARGAVDKRL